MSDGSSLAMFLAVTSQPLPFAGIIHIFIDFQEYLRAGGDSCGYCKGEHVEPDRPPVGVKDTWPGGVYGRKFQG